MPSTKRTTLAERRTADALFTPTEAPDHRGRGRPQLLEPNVKLTAYVTLAQDVALEEARLVRRRAGQRVDKSTLVREAIDLFLRQEGSA